MRLLLWAIAPSALWWLLMLTPLGLFYAWFFMFFAVLVCSPLFLLDAMLPGIVGSLKVLTSPSGSMIAYPNGMLGWLLVITFTFAWLYLFLAIGRLLKRSKVF